MRNIYVEQVRRILEGAEAHKRAGLESLKKELEIRSSETRDIRRHEILQDKDGNYQIKRRVIGVKTVPNMQALEAMGMCIQELEKLESPGHKPAAMPDPAPLPSGGLGRIRRKGSKTDLGRVYNIPGKSIDCTGVEWERHFMGPARESMQDATDIHDVVAVSKSPEIQAIAMASRNMKPEPE